MSLIDFIAFIAAMLFLLVSRISQSREANKKNKEVLKEADNEHLEVFEEQELRNAKKLQEILEEKRKDRLSKRMPSSHLQVKQVVQPKAQLQQKLQPKPANFLEKATEDDLLHAFNNLKKPLGAYTTKTPPLPSRGSQLLKKLDSTKDMVILNEILSKPKGF